MGRRGYMKTAAAGIASAAALSPQVVGGALAATSVDLGEEGLSDGDVIDSYLDEHLASGAEVHVPEGEYEWQGDGLGGDYSDAALVGDGDVTLQFSGDYWNVNCMAVDGGDFRISNVTVRGPVDSNDNKSRFRFDARDPESEITLDNFNLPDGDVGQGRAIGIYVGSGHEGTVRLTNCHVEGFPNNGLYAGAYGRSGAGGGRTVVESCFFKNNNIDAVRLGGDRDTIRNCVIVQEEVPAIHTGAKSGRGIRIRYPGDDVTVENVHITCDTSSPFIVPDRAGSPSGAVDGLYIENNTGGTAAYVESGSFDAENVHVSGSGNQNVSGFDSAADVYSGSDADAPATSLSELDAADGGTGGSSDDSDGGSGDGSDDGSSGGSNDGSDDSSLEHTLTVDGTTSSAKSYRFEVTGDLEPDSNFNPDDTIDGNVVNGRMFSSSDSYQFSGDLVSFDSDSLDEMTVYVDGNRIDPTTVGELPHEINVRGSGVDPKEYTLSVSGEIERGGNINPDDTVSESSVDGVVWWSSDTYRFSGELEDVEVDSPDDVTVTVNGSEVDPERIGGQPLPNRVVVDGTGSDGEASYSFQVTDAIEGSAELGSLEADDTVSGTSVDGTVGDDLDGYRFAGNLVAMNVDGAAKLTIEQSDRR